MLQDVPSAVEPIGGGLRLAGGARVAGRRDHVISAGRVYCLGGEPGSERARGLDRFGRPSTGGRCAEGSKTPVASMTAVAAGPSCSGASAIVGCS